MERKKQSFYVAGYLIEERRRWPIIVGVLRHKKYLKAALHSTNVSIGTIVV